MAQHLVLSYVLYSHCHFNLLPGLMFLILGFTEDETSEIVSTLREANGKVVANPKTFHGIPDYVIVPFEGRYA